MKILLVLATLLAQLSLSFAQPQEAFPLWPDGAPGAWGVSPKDIPTFTPFWPTPDKATGAAKKVE